MELYFVMIIIRCNFKNKFLKENKVQKNKEIH